MKITRMTTGEWGKTRAFFDVEIEVFTIKGFKLIDGANGYFVGNPSAKDKEGEYRDSVFVEKEVKQTLVGLALDCHKGGGIKPSVMEAAPVGVDDAIPF